MSSQQTRRYFGQKSRYNLGDPWLYQRSSVHHDKVAIIFGCGLPAFQDLALLYTDWISHPCLIVMISSSLPYSSPQFRANNVKIINQNQNPSTDIL